MAQYLITTYMTAELIVECTDEAEAKSWSNRIVATLEDENGNTVPPETVEYFEASVKVGDVIIEKLPLTA